jgi:hypothetical protein
MRKDGRVVERNGIVFPGIRVCDYLALWLGGAVLLAFLVSSTTLAHISRSHFVEQRTWISVSPTNIDIDIGFRFYAPLSVPERKRIDGDGDGQLSPEEIGAFLRGVQSQAQENLALSVDGRRIPLIPLYEPALDLGTALVATGHPHAVRLSFFARTPPWLIQGSLIRLENSLWKDFPVIPSCQAVGREGMEVAVEDGAHGSWTSPGDAVRFSLVRCLSGTASPEMAGLGAETLNALKTGNEITARCSLRASIGFWGSCLVLAAAGLLTLTIRHRMRPNGGG